MMDKHDGQTISNLEKAVDRVFPLEGFNNADECPKCFGYGEYILAERGSDRGEVVRCDCGAGVVR